MSVNLRKLINEHLDKNIIDKSSVALLFSGGTDSLTCLFSLMDLGIRPTLYSFHMEGVIHKDIEISKQVSEHYQLNHKIIEIKRDINQLIEDVKFIISYFKVTRKTNIQCTYPFLHVLPEVKEKFVVSGLCADDLYGTSKSMIIKCSKDKYIFDKTRDRILSNFDSSAYRLIKQLVENVHNKRFIAPYRDQTIIDFFYKYSWEDLNKPKQKQIAVTAYNEFFRAQKIYRTNVNLQVGSKVREWHSELVETKINKNKRWRVDEIYKDLGRELII